jgi:hypothetical protein
MLRKIVGELEGDIIHAFGDDWGLDHRTPVVRTFLGSSLGEARASTGLRKFNHYVLALTEYISMRRAAYKIAIGADSNVTFNCDMVMPPVVAIDGSPGVRKSIKPLVIFIGSFEGRKRGELVEKTVAQVSESLGRDVNLTVIGPKDDAHKWSPKTTHHDGADDETVQSLVASAWTLMAPSLYEGFGIPAFEALTLQTAVIASKNPGSEYIKSFMMSTSSLELVDDDGLAKSLSARILAGPHWAESDRKNTSDGVKNMLIAADPAQLVRVVYKTVLGRRR